MSTNNYDDIIEQDFTPIKPIKIDLNILNKQIRDGRHIFSPKVLKQNGNIQTSDLLSPLEN